MLYFDKKGTKMKIFNILLATFAITTASFADKPVVEKEIPKFMKIDDFKLKTVNGNSIDMLSQKKGYLFDEAKDKLSIFVIWDKGSKDSRKWLKQMQELQNSNPEKIFVSALEINNMPPQEIAKFAKENKITYPMFSAIQNKDFASQALVKFGFFSKDKKTGKPGGVPLTMMFDYNGKGIYRAAGISDKDKFKNYVQAVIKVLDKKQGAKK